MHTFIDNAGRTWTLAVNVGAIKRVRALCGIDLANIISIETGKDPDISVLKQLSQDPVLLVNTVYAICKNEADSKNTSDEDFGQAMAGDAIENATTALLDEVVDFFPQAKRAIFQKILSASRRFEAKTKEALNNLLNDPNLDAKLDQALEMLNSSSTTVQES
jgi:hypothetical protein